MQIKNTQNQHHRINKSHEILTSSARNFANDLKNQQNFNTKSSQKIDISAAPHSVSPQSNNIKLGSLTGSHKTVAELLLAHPQLKTKTWSIIHNPVNQNKAFHQIAAGKEIYFNQKTQELHWSEFKSSGRNTNFVLNSVLSLDKTNITATSETEEKTSAVANHKIVLGQLSQQHPNILKLLSQHSDFKTQRWNIIHSEVNNNKAFTKIPSGSTIYIDSKSKELSWAHSSLDPEQSIKTTTEHGRMLATRLDDAVKPYMGTEYKHLDCYTLVVNGLENMGVQYRGKGSLSRQLIHRAQADGRVNNAYFTGEGLSEALGNKIYTRAIAQVHDIEQQSKAVFQEMQGLMKKGDILSFSLASKGHTGVISQNKQQWTYINSGRLDNSINANAPRHGVGEETLLKEINNWVKLAQRRNESLQITVGRLDRQKFA